MRRGMRSVLYLQKISAVLLQEKNTLAFVYFPIHKAPSLIGG